MTHDITIENACNASDASSTCSHIEPVNNTVAPKEWIVDLDVTFMYQHVINPSENIS